MAKSKRQQRRAYRHGEPSPSMNVTVIGGVFALLIIGVLAGVLLMQMMGGLGTSRSQASSTIQQNQSQAAATATAYTQAQAALPRVEMAEAKRLYDANAAVFMDARNASEYQQGHITNALSVPLVDFQTVQASLPADKSTPIIAYCA